MRILIADREPKVRFALRIALEQQPGSTFFGEATDAQELIAQAKEPCPDLAVINWELPGLPITELLSTLRARCGDTHIIVLSSRYERREQALLAGADAFVCMCDAPDGLLSAIEKCLDRGTHLGSHHVYAISDNPSGIP